MLKSPPPIRHCRPFSRDRLNPALLLQPMLNYFRPNLSALGLWPAAAPAAQLILGDALGFFPRRLALPPGQVQNFQISMQKFGLFLTFKGGRLGC
jgi:hypothetical protein